MDCARFAVLFISLSGLTGCGPSGPGLAVSPANDSCAGCHAAIHTEWSSSAHARGGNSPVFRALLPHVEQAWGTAAADTCVACHEPGPRHGLPEVEGIGCVMCHAATKNREPRDGQLVVDTSAPLAGPFTDGMANGAHGCRPSGILGSSELCATCHEVTGPRLFVETTGSEASGPLSCADCHMPTASPQVIAPGGPLRPRRSHHFVGLDPAWDADPADAALAAAATRMLLADALQLSAYRQGADVVVQVKNVGAGHAVPTGVSFLRDIWVEVDGQRVMELGARLLMGGQDTVLVTEADEVIPRGLAPGESRSVELSHPQSATVVLRARAFRQPLLDRLGLSHRSHEVPVHEVHSVVLP